ncbi:hypothetical protein ACKLNO_07860 [Neisseriaceae bacterium B1]
MSETIFSLFMLAWIAFLIAMADGFSHIGGWLILLACCAVFGIIIYFERASKNKRASRTETILATVIKWIMRGLSGTLILLFIVWTGFVLYGYFVANEFDGETTLWILLNNAFFIIFLTHFFIFGNDFKEERRFDQIRQKYRERKKRYHWKW